MVIHGREYNFLLTVGASAEIADLCPDGDMSNLSAMLDGTFSETIGVTAKVISALSKGYEQNRAYEEDYEPHCLTVEEIMTLTQGDFAKLQAEAVKAFQESQETTVEVESGKKK